VAVALIFGLLAGVALAFLLNLLNSKVKLWEELSDLYGVAALAGIPQLSRRTATARDREIELEPFRILHNSLALLAPGQDINTALITSAVPGEGKTTVAIGLARAAALSGNDVVLVEADLRRPSFAERLSVDGRAPGLAAVLFDGEDPMELLQTPFPGIPRLRVLPAGAVPQDAANRLRPHDLTRAFEGLSARLDLIVIDSAPLLPVVDTRVLLDEVAIDATLIVARAGVTRREEIRGVRALLDHRGLTNVGLVVNGLTSSTGSYYYGDDRAPSSEERLLASRPGR
jgi:succinoglycan biosynthesis transport protein ExoP